jgi:hypothetical protein
MFALLPCPEIDAPLQLLQLRRVTRKLPLGEQHRRDSLNAEPIGLLAAIDGLEEEVDCDEGEPRLHGDQPEAIARALTPKAPRD